MDELHLSAEAVATALWHLIPMMVANMAAFVVLMGLTTARYCTQSMNKAGRLKYFAGRISLLALVQIVNTVIFYLIGFFEMTLASAALAILLLASIRAVKQDGYIDNLGRAAFVATGIMVFITMFVGLIALAMVAIYS